MQAAATMITVPNKMPCDDLDSRFRGNDSFGSYILLKVVSEKRGYRGGR